jgi:hypothetical protein
MIARASQQMIAKGIVAQYLLRMRTPAWCMVSSLLPVTQTDVGGA